MQPAELQARLDAIIAPIVTDMGLVLVRVQLTGQAGSLTLQVMAEDPATGQMTISQCTRLSRALDLPLDEADPIDGEYALEVSSPGIDRPLTRRSDWANWAGHEAKMRLEPKVEHRARAQGIIVALDGDEVVLDLKSVGEVRLPLANIHGAKLVLTDRLIASTKPLDASGAEEIIETPAQASDSMNDEPVNDNDTPED
ncbi:ribosome maturation factor [Sandarakinorhabdus sp.]|uniref:ribosome maturation factor n=1 Tax=Sandarakinorhabdus sp. TaxID=1916663 RepID=UPI00286DB10E|nr:ribosome maturation factor [Sandarakinorhabdus sp.]